MIIKEKNKKMKINIKRTIFITIIQTVLNLIAFLAVGMGIYIFTILPSCSLFIEYFLISMFSMGLILLGIFILVAIGIVTSLLFEEESND